MPEIFPAVYLNKIIFPAVYLNKISTVVDK